MYRATRSRACSVGIVALLLLSTGCGKSAAPPAEEEKHPAPVHAAKVEKASYGEWMELIGTTQPLPGRLAHVNTLVEGRVQSLLGDPRWVAAMLGKTASGATLLTATTSNVGGPPSSEGQPVVEGQFLLQLDDRVARANRDKVQFTLRELEEQKKQADYVVELARIDVNRLDELMRSQTAGVPLPLTSRVEMDKARVALKDAESKHRSVLAREETLREELKALNDQLTFYTVRAPLSGRLGLIQAMPGQTLAIGAGVTDIVDLQEIDVFCFAPPRVAAHLALGQPAKLIVDEKEGAEPIEGKVAFLAASAQADTGNIALKVRFPNTRMQLRANMVRRVQILTKPAEERLAISEEAVMEDQDPPAVVIISVETKDGKEEKKARKLHAVLGVRDPEHHRIEIRELIDPAKKDKFKVEDVLLITEGGHGLHDGDLVALEEEKKEEDKKEEPKKEEAKKEEK